MQRATVIRPSPDTTLDLFFFFFFLEEAKRQAQKCTVGTGQITTLMAIRRYNNTDTRHAALARLAVDQRGRCTRCCRSPPRLLYVKEALYELQARQARLQSPEWPSGYDGDNWC